MRMKNTLSCTLRNAPAEATKDIESYKLMLRAGIIRKEAPGVFNFLPLGMKVVNNIKKVILDTMEKLNSEEIKSSYLSNAFINGFTTKDCYNNTYSLNRNYISKLTGTFGEVLENTKNNVYRFHEFTTDFENIEKPKHGLLKCRENIIFQGFEIQGLESEESKENPMKEEIIKDLENMGLDVFTLKNCITNDLIIEDIVVSSDLGEDMLLQCKSCETMEESEMFSIHPQINQQDEVKDKNKVLTPDIKTIDDLVKFLDIKKENIAKTLIYKAGKKTIAVMIPGNRDASEGKIKEFLKCFPIIDMADEESVKFATGADIGFAGPIGIKADYLLVDEEVANMKNFVVGANDTNYHYINVNYGRDFEGLIGDFKTAEGRDTCKECDGELCSSSYIKIGSFITNKNIGIKGRSSVTVNEIKINISRVLGLIVENHSKENEIIWPEIICPYHVAIIIALGKNEEQIKAGEDLYKRIRAIDKNVILDDREDRVGAKFKDIELMGVPVRIVVGKYIKDGMVEYKDRNSDEPSIISLDEVVDRIN